jgi:hypothetical protein
MAGADSPTTRIGECSVAGAENHRIGRRVKPRFARLLQVVQAFRVTASRGALVVSAIIGPRSDPIGFVVCRISVWSGARLRSIAGRTTVDASAIGCVLTLQDGTTVRTVITPDPGYDGIPYTRCRCGEWFHTAWFRLHDCAPIHANAPRNLRTPPPMENPC